MRRDNFSRKTQSLVLMQIYDTEVKCSASVTPCHQKVMSAAIYDYVPIPYSPRELSSLLGTGPLEDRRAGDEICLGDRMIVDRDLIQVG